MNSAPKRSARTTPRAPGPPTLRLERLEGRNAPGSLFTSLADFALTSGLPLPNGDLGPPAPDLFAGDAVDNGPALRGHRATPDAGQGRPPPADPSPPRPADRRASAPPGTAPAWATGPGNPGADDVQALRTSASFSFSAAGSATSAPLPHDPILFVHGWHGSPWNWAVMISRFKADGWTDQELWNWSYNSDQSNAITAQQLGAKVDQVLAATGAGKVDLITHSMGALPSRYYLKNLGGDLKVDDWVSLGGPNHGTYTAYAVSSPAGVEMRPGSAFLRGLNAGDETPGAPNYGTWWSPCDELIIPRTSVPLSAGPSGTVTNTETACLSHFALPVDATVYAQVRDFVA
jgi:triacylglycerol lipase